MPIDVNSSLESSVFEIYINMYPICSSSFRLFFGCYIQPNNRNSIHICQVKQVVKQVIMVQPLQVNVNYIIL